MRLLKYFSSKIDTLKNGLRWIRHRITTLNRISIRFHQLCLKVAIQLLEISRDFSRLKMTWNTAPQSSPVFRGLTLVLSHGLKQQNYNFLSILGEDITSLLSTWQNEEIIRKERIWLLTIRNYRWYLITYLTEMQAMTSFSTLLTSERLLAHLAQKVLVTFRMDYETLNMFL